MRDHLLGCYQFQADLAHTQPAAVGVPNRLKRAPAKVKDTSARDFEAGDKTPVSMRADFPHEYDLHTMYGDAAKDAYRKTKNWLYGDFEPASIGVDPARPGGDRTAVGVLMLQEQANKELESIRSAVVRVHAENRAEIVARILADKQALRPGKKPLALDLGL